MKPALLIGGRPQRELQKLRLPSDGIAENYLAIDGFLQIVILQLH
jgi:hypothetical protein